MNAILTDIVSLIVANSNWVGGTNLFAGREPTSPSNTLTLFDVPGGNRLLYKKRDLNDLGSDAYEYASFQIRIRNADYEQGMLQASEIIDILHGVGNEIVGGSLYTVIQAVDNPALLEWDEDNRAKIVVNFQLQRRPN